MSGIPQTGKADRATRAAAEAVRAQYPNAHGLALLPKLDEFSAVSWCREIATVKPALRKYLPAAGKPLVAGPDGPGNTPRRMLQSSFNEVEGFFRKSYGIHTASRIDIAAAGSAEELGGYVEQLQRQRGEPFGRTSPPISQVCETSGRYVNGQALFDQLLICWPEVRKYDAAWGRKIRAAVTSVMAHEYMHHIQYELANFKNGYYGRWKIGPNWMVEGGAELGAYNWGIKRGGARRLSLLELQKPARENSITLRDLAAARGAWGRQHYETARFAVWLLAKRFGEDRVITYWRLIGQGKSWAGAFKSAFGMSLGQYSKLFEKLRRDPAQAAAFIAGA